MRTSITRTTYSYHGVVAEYGRSYACKASKASVLEETKIDPNVYVPLMLCDFINHLVFVTFVVFTSRSSTGYSHLQSHQEIRGYKDLV